MSDHAGVDFRPVKALFSQILPPGDPLREAALATPDWLSRGEGIPTLTVFFRMWVERSRQAGGLSGAAGGGP